MTRRDAPRRGSAWPAVLPSCSGRSCRSRACFLYKQHLFPKFSNFPNAKVPPPGKVFVGIFGANGWTGLLTAAAGGLLLFGAAQHLLAKTMSLINGIALGAAAIIAPVSGNVLGLAAANGWTEILWGGSAAILLFNTLIPRRKKTVEDDRAAAAPQRREVEPTPAAQERSDRAAPGAERVETDGSRDAEEVGT
ncbi:MAG: hypothetical protein ACR2NR_19550 [Solirubrobacteraceae bacterium]